MNKKIATYRVCAGRYMGFSSACSDGSNTALLAVLQRYEMALKSIYVRVDGRT